MVFLVYAAFRSFLKVDSFQIVAIEMVSQVF